MAYLYDPYNGDLICVLTCDGAGETDIAVTAASGLVSERIPICCTDGACDYGFDPNTGLLYPVLCP